MPRTHFSSTTSLSSAEGTSPLKLVSVIQSNYKSVSTDTSTSSGSYLDLLDDGSGAMGQFCVSNDSNSDSNTGASTCKCEFTYIRSTTGAQESFQTDTVYHETDLIRCSSDGIPTDIDNLAVRIRLSDSSYTNEVIYSYNISSSGLTASDANSYIRIRRYQCRDNIWIPHLLDGSIYDPILSDDKSLSYPLNFYASNLFSALDKYAQQEAKSGVGWDCPSNATESTTAPEMMIFSEEFDDNHKDVIFPPPVGTFDRYTFYLAREPIPGVLDTPVNAFIAPQITSISFPTSTSQHPPIGYGAAPTVTTSLLSNKEECPSVEIPAGFQWVKIWLFRASLPVRKYPTSYNITPEVVRYIACNPYPALLSDGNTPVFADCGKSGKAGNVNGQELADRVFGAGRTGNRCAQLEALNLPDCLLKGSGCTTDEADPTKQKVAFTEFKPGTDIWLPRGGSASLTCTSSSSDDPVNLNDPLGVCINYHNNARVPHDEAGTALKDLDTSGNSRFDFLFVVTPSDVTSDQMKNQQLKQYIPYRFHSAADCPDGNPSAHSGDTYGQCSAEKRINYEIVMHDVNVPGDASTDDPSRLPAFPVCALQPIK